MTTQHILYDLTGCGVRASVSILGDLRILLPMPGFPVVFLIDETHALDCINQNLLIAKQIIENCGVSFVGVESRYGGFKWDDINRHQYTNDFDLGDHQTAANTFPQFADGMIRMGVSVYGVECQGLANELECDQIDRPDSGPVGERPFNIARSEHFIRTLFQLRAAHRLDGNMILNAGGNHNTHIAKWIREGTIEDKAGQKAAYVRLRAPAYRESLKL